MKIPTVPLSEIQQMKDLKAHAVFKLGISCWIHNTEADSSHMMSCFDVLYGLSIWLTGFDGVSAVVSMRWLKKQNTATTTRSNSVGVPLFSAPRECSSFSCWSRRCRSAVCSESRLCLSAFIWSRVCWCCFLKRCSLAFPSRTSSHSQRSLVWVVMQIQNQCAVRLWY